MSADAFDAAQAASLLGHPGATVAEARELLPDLWRVVLTGGDLPADWWEVMAFVWERGAMARDRGPAALGAYLRRVRIHEVERVTPFAVQVLLDVLDAAPPGFRSDQVDAVLQATGERASVSARPFEVTLLTSSYGAGAPAGDDGWAPEILGRAHLGGTSSHDFAWRVETRAGAASPWRLVATIALG